MCGAPGNVAWGREFGIETTGDNKIKWGELEEKDARLIHIQKPCCTLMMES